MRRPPSFRWLSRVLVFCCLPYFLSLCGLRLNGTLVALMTSSTETSRASNFTIASHILKASMSTETRRLLIVYVNRKRFIRPLECNWSDGSIGLLGHSPEVGQGA